MAFVMFGSSSLAVTRAIPSVKASEALASFDSESESTRFAFSVVSTIALSASVTVFEAAGRSFPAS